MLAQYDEHLPTRLADREPYREPVAPRSSGSGVDPSMRGGPQPRSIRNASTPRAGHPRCAARSCRAARRRPDARAPTASGTGTTESTAAAHTREPDGPRSIPRSASSHATSSMPAPPVTIRNVGLDCVAVTEARAPALSIDHDICARGRGAARRKHEATRLERFVEDAAPGPTSSSAKRSSSATRRARSQAATGRQCFIVVSMTTNSQATPSRVTSPLAESTPSWRS